MEQLKDYDLAILYYPEKANVVVDALSQKLLENLVMLITTQPPLLTEMRRLKIEVVTSETTIKLIVFMVQPTLLERIKEK